MTPLNRLAADNARREFAALVSRGIEERDLARAALLIAEEEEPHEDVDGRIAHYLGALDRMGAGARARLARLPSDDQQARLEAFNEFMFMTQGFAGNTDNYYDPRNSLLPHVIERRTGIPITLSVLYMEVGRRAGLRVEGVGLPGHFVVRVCDSDEQSPNSDGTLVDPFWRRTIDRRDCRERLDTIYNGRVTLADEHLRKVSARQILLRMLQNLKSVYSSAGMDRDALGVVERLLLLAPADRQERRDYGLLLARAGRHAEGARELQALLAGAGGDERETLAEAIRRVQSQMARLN